MSYKLHNSSLDVISSKFSDLRNALGSINVLDQCVNLQFGVTFSKDRLDLQATVFADEIFRLSNIKWRYVTGSSSKAEQYKRLREIYIYSYAKALMYGLNSSKVKELPVNSPIFIGHGVFHRLLQSSGFRMRAKDGFSLNTSIQCTEEHRKELIKTILEAYPWLKKCLRNDVSGGFSFFSSIHDNILTELLDTVNAIKMKRKEVTDAKNGVVGNKPAQQEDIDTKYQSSYVYDNGTPFSRSAGSFDLIQSDRLLHIVSLDGNVLDEFITDEHNPLACSALDINNSEIWYYCSSGNKKLLDQFSCFISRGCFIYLDNDGDGDNTWSEGRYMDVLPKASLKDILVISEVRSLTYLEVRSGLPANGNDESDDFVKPILSPSGTPGKDGNSPVP